MPVSVHTLRDRVVAKLATLSGWRISSGPYELFPTVDAWDALHQAFAVAVSSTKWDSPIESSPRKRGSDGGLVQSDVRVRWAYHVRADSFADDSGLADDAEATLYKALIALSLTGGVHIHIVDMTKALRVSENGHWYIGEIRAVVNHQLALS